jgi:hypothetical protein
MALIQRMEGYKTQVPVPRWNLRSDEDITSVANTLLRTIPARILLHIHSHQDENTEWQQLKFPAQLNIMADELATQQRNQMDKPAEEVKNIATAQLRINNMAITRDSQRELLTAAGKIPLQEYYHQKWGWSHTVFDTISWTIQHKALRHFEIGDQTRILKFVHGWLPTQSCLYKEGAATSPRCKLCHDLYENNVHLLNCRHEAMQQVREHINDILMKQYHDHGNSKLINIIQLAIDPSSQNDKWTPSTEDTSPELRAAIIEQSKI